MPVALDRLQSQAWAHLRKRGLWPYG
jgi:hypothetical protein